MGLHNTPEQTGQLKGSGQVCPGRQIKVGSSVWLLSNLDNATPELTTESVVTLVNDLEKKRLKALPFHEGKIKLIKIINLMKCFSLS